MPVEPESYQQQLRAYVEYLRDLGVYDLYRHGSPIEAELTAAPARLEPPVTPIRPTVNPARPAVVPRAPAILPSVQTSASSLAPPSLNRPVAPRELPPEPDMPILRPIGFNQLAPLPEVRVAAADRTAALHAIQEEIGDCTRCPLAYAGRRKIVFGNGDPAARLMFVGEGPGADEDASGEPFVGKAGQLLNNMVNAMGLQREQVYVANIVKCRPPNNRVPEPVEANTCSPFLLRQIDTVQPQVIVALGATAALYLLGVKQSLASLRGSWHECRGAKLAVTYHPAFLLRDPRQKGEAWKDLQMVMKELGLEAPKRPV